MLELRKNASSIIRRIQKGETYVLTYRGKQAVELKPVIKKDVLRDDPFYLLPDLAMEGKSLSNEEMDKIIYEQ